MDAGIKPPARRERDPVGPAGAVVPHRRVGGVPPGRRHAGYISWEEFMANQRHLADKHQSSRGGSSRSAPQGLALLQGIAVCGRCGRRMSVHYTGPNGDYPGYVCANRSGPNGGSVVSGGAGPGGGCQCGGDPAGGAQAGPDRDCIGHPWAGGPGSKSSWSGSGRCGGARTATRPSAPGANTIPSSPRTGWWRAPWSGPGSGEVARRGAGRAGLRPLVP